jgi:hypothetical protein
MPIDQVKKDEGKPKATVQQKTREKNFFLLLKSDSSLIQPKWSEILTIEI